MKIHVILLGCSLHRYAKRLIRVPNERNKPLHRLMLIEIADRKVLLSRVHSEAEPTRVSVIELDHLVADALRPVEIRDQLHIITEQIMVKIRRARVRLRIERQLR